MAVPLLKDGDKVLLPTSWQGGVMILSPVGPQPLKGTGKATLKGKKVVLEKDLSPASWKVNVKYQRGAFQNGQGIVTIKKGSVHLTGKSKCTGQAMALFDKGYVAELTVTVPALGPPPSNPPDPMPKFSGKGKFMRAPAVKIKGT